MRRKIRQVGGFSLLELVIVVVIMGIIAAIAIPRMSRASKSAGEAAVESNLAVLQNAIEQYAAEHDGTYPTVADFEKQLTAKIGDYGPYLRKIPEMTTGDNKGSTKVAAAAAKDVAWIYDADTGEITANK